MSLSDRLFCNHHAHPLRQAWSYRLRCAKGVFVWFESRLNPWYISIPSNPNLYSTKIIMKMRWQTIASSVSMRTINQKLGCLGTHMKPTAYGGTDTPGTHPQEHMTTMGKGDTSDLMVIIRPVIYISPWRPKLECVSPTYTAPHIAKKMKKVSQRTNYISDTLSTECTQQAFTHPSKIFHRMCSMQANKSAWWSWWEGVEYIKPNTTSRPLCILPYAYGTHNKLCSIRRNEIQLTQNPSEW